MIENAQGLVLRARLFSETSLIVQWLTRESGRVDTIAKGARRPKSPFRGKLDLFYLADFSFARSRRSTLHTLREVNLLETHAPLRRELGHLEQASHCARLIELATEKETPLPAVFELLRGCLDILPLTPPRPQTVFAFELKLLAELGLSPDLQDTALTPGARRVATLLMEGDWTAVSRLKPSEAQTAELERFLHGFLVFHLGKAR